MVKVGGGTASVWDERTRRATSSAQTTRMNTDAKKSVSLRTTRT